MTEIPTIHDPRVDADWPRGLTMWVDGRTLHVSVPFTWNIYELNTMLRQKSMLWDDAIVGGPGVYLVPERIAKLDYVRIGDYSDGVLQRVHPMATRTTVGCVRRCQFCAIGIGKVEPGGMKELADWPDLPIICDNNILAASMPHIERVCERLSRWGWADFNQGLDARLLTPEKARLLATIKKPMVRLALDSHTYVESWLRAVNLLMDAGIAKSNIRSYCLIGFDSGPDEAWTRCEFVQMHGIYALPMWYHNLDQMEANIVTVEQERLGWSNKERLSIMGYYYRHRGEVPQVEAGHD